MNQPEAFDAAQRHNAQQNGCCPVCGLRPGQTCANSCCATRLMQRVIDAQALAIEALQRRRHTPMSTYGE